MYMLNKVRETKDQKLYEVISYDIKTPDTFKIITLDREGFIKTFDNPSRDYAEKNGYLISSVETVNTLICPPGEIIITNSNKTLFDFLMELAELQAYFLPASLYTGGEIKSENTNNFSNIRVSNSTMFMGFSVLNGNNWLTSSVMSVDENDYISTSQFYIALAEDKVLSIPLDLVSKARVNGQDCNIFKYNGELTVFPYFEPADYIPLPILNHLNYFQTLYKVACDFVSDLLEKDGVTSLYDERVISSDVKKSISIAPSIKPTSRNRRAELIEGYGMHSGSFESFASSYKLNNFEVFIFTILSKLTKQQIDNELPTLLRKLRIERCRYSLALMEFRSKIFLDASIFPPHYMQIIAEGGCSGFHTTIKRNF